MRRARKTTSGCSIRSPQKVNDKPSQRMGKKVDKNKISTFQEFSRFIDEQQTHEDNDK